MSIRLVSIAKKLLRLTIILLLVLTLSELALRVVGYGDYIIYEAHPRLLWVPAKNQKGRTVDGPGGNINQ